MSHGIGSDFDFSMEIYHVCDRSDER
jgi:hypothetical protein